MAKNIAVGILGVIVLILSIFGITKYKKNNSIDIGIGVGNVGIGTGEYKNKGGGFDIGGGSGSGKTKKGQFLKCTEYRSDELTNTYYIEFRNNKFYPIVQYKVEATVSAEYMNKHSKKELEAELADYIGCSRDQEHAICGNMKIKWKSRTLIATFAYDLTEMCTSVEYKKNYKYCDMNRDEFLKYANESKIQCEKVSKGTIYATKADPKGTYYKKYGYKEEKVTVSDVKEAIKESKATAKEINKINQKAAEDSVSNISVKKADANKTTTGTVTKKCTKENLMIKAEPINVDSETSSIRVTVTNISKQTCKIDEIRMTLKDKNGKFVMNLPVYVGETIKAGETRKTTSGTNADLFRVDSSKTIYTIK